MRTTRAKFSALSLLLLSLVSIPRQESFVVDSLEHSEKSQRNRSFSCENYAENVPESFKNLLKKQNEN